MRVWKRVNETWYGYGNGVKAVLYESVETECVKIIVSRGEVQIATHWSSGVSSAKRWAERNYLKTREILR